jgi:hypothetical protein
MDDDPSMHDVERAPGTRTVMGNVERGREIMAGYENQPRTITLAQLADAYHTINHMHGGLWARRPGCGCTEIAELIWDRISDG